ncbi:hypothetical protein MUK42_02226 [Musa troglodytarum]|uniref:Uncharacterized protein n=1 Tax=Musa troglodytarum TaxID=320322 RepID=A0A9E7EJS7_9LILI|nr:hypothetical protein MUK42_02226 [Musa troglodytarum]
MMPTTSGGAGERTRKLFVVSASGGGGSAIPVSDGGGVDLGAVGRALGLDPSSVTLNGYFISRRPDFVSSFTWGSLVSFFTSRGFPTGASQLDPVVIQGKPALASGLQFSPFPEEGDHLAFKRKATSEDEHPINKKNRFDGVGDGYLNGGDSLCIKRRLKLEDDYSSKKRKI